MNGISEQDLSTGSELVMDMKLSEVLRNLIQSKGITVSSLSKSTRVPAQTIHNWLSSTKPRDIDQVKRVADHLGVTLDYLLFGIGQSHEKGFEDFKNEINAGVFEVVLRRVKK